MELATILCVSAVFMFGGYTVGMMSGDRFANKVLEAARQTVEICNDAIEKCNTFADKINDRYERLASDYRRLFDAYDEAYRILEENGLVGGDGNETLSGDDGTEENA